MKLAMVAVSENNEPIILHDEKSKGPRTLALGWQERLGLLLAIAVASLLLWYGLLEPAFRSAAIEAVRVPRAQQVVTCDTDVPLRVGDTVFIAGKFAPISGKIVALPLQSAMDRDASGPQQLVILGLNQYYIVTADGTAKVFTRTDIRGLVQT